MSQVLICTICNGIYTKGQVVLYNGIYLCPNARCNCGTTLISVDENLADIILKIFNLGLETLHSCEGHPWSLNSYITFSQNLDGYYPLTIEEIRNIAIKVNESLDNLFFITEIVFENNHPPNLRDIEPIDHKVFSLLLEYNKNLSTIEKLEYKLDFLNGLYLLLYELREKIERKQNNVS